MSEEKWVKSKHGNVEGNTRHVSVWDEVCAEIEQEEAERKEACSILEPTTKATLSKMETTDK